MMKPFYSIIILTIYIITGCQQPDKPSGQKSSQNKNTAIALTNDGAWCWFSDPRAVYLEGKSGQVVFGYINSGGDVMIGAHHLTSGKTTAFTLHDSLEIDDHNVPTILELPDGHLLAFYNAHNGHVFMRRSLQPGDISQWSDERIIARENEKYNYTYTNPVRLEKENGRIYIFGRKVGPTRSFEHWWMYYKYSDDDGATWSDDIVLLDNEGRKNPPYMKIATDHQSRIDILFTDGHPKIGDDISIYHMYYAEGQFKQTGGSPIGTTEDLPISIASVDKVYDASKTRIRAWIWDLALNSENQPVITYARYPTENDHRYHYAHWDGQKWKDEEICKSGGWMPALRQGDRVREAHYSGGVVLDPSDPREVYLSREINGKFEIERKVFSENGKWFSEYLTSASSQSNMRPYVAYGSPVGKPVVLWMNGDYRHYTDYRTSINAWFPGQED